MKYIKKFESDEYVSSTDHKKTLETLEDCLMELFDKYGFEEEVGQDSIGAHWYNSGTYITISFIPGKYIDSFYNDILKSKPVIERRIKSALTITRPNSSRITLFANSTLGLYDKY